MSKGDTRRPAQIPAKQVEENWDRIFNKKVSISESDETVENLKDIVVAFKESKNNEQSNNS